MLIKRFILCFLIFGLPTALFADVRPGDLPAATKWYFHVDFEEMRDTEAGQHLYRFLQGEVFDEIREETGVDLDKEADRITALAAGDEMLIVVIDGNISQETQDMAMGMGAATGAMDRFESGGKAYYYIKNDDHHKGDDGEESDSMRHEYSDEYDLNGLDKGAYFSFDVKNKVIVTSGEADMQAMLKNKGKVPTSDAGKGALLVLSADKSLIQAGLDTDDFANGAGWDSNIINNTEQLALLIADEAGKIAIKAQLVAAEKAMAESLASIVRGLISLQAFNSEMDPEISEFLQNTNVDVEGSTLTIKVALDPEVVIAAIE
mgnify:CR=1 FL=1